MNKLDLARNYELVEKIVSSCGSLKDVDYVVSSLTESPVGHQEIILESMIISPHELSSNIAIATLLQVNEEFGMKTLYGLSLQPQWHWFVAYTVLNSRFGHMADAMIRILCFSPSVSAKIMAAYTLLRNERNEHYDLVLSFSTDASTDSQGRSLGDSIKAYIDDLNSLNTL